jgi:ligand-binding sensor domain-containing protein
VLAVVSGGVWRSTDYGANWSPVLPDDSSIAVRQLAFNRTSDDVYLATSRGLFHSPDRGASWFSEDMVGGAEPTSVAIAFDGATMYVPTKKGLYVTKNRGAKWEVRDSVTDIRAIAVSQKAPYSVFIATSEGLKSSDDRGATWKSVTLPAQNVTNVVALESTLHVVADSTHYRSSDGGKTWPAISSAGVVKFLMAVSKVDLLARSNDRLVHSGDAGTTWREMALASDLPLATFAVPPDRPREIWSGLFYDGISVSSDGGKSWSSRNHGLTAQSIHALASDPASPAMVYAAAGHLYRSADHGRTWEILRRTTGVPITDVIVGGDGAIYATLATEVERSTDAGKTWLKLEEPKFPGVVTSDPQSKRGLYTLKGTQLAHSDDRGATWKTIGSELAGVGRVIPASGKSLYILGSRGVSYSDNGGKEWSRLQLELGEGTKITGLTEAAKDPKVVYLATTAGAFRSTNGASGPFEKLTGGLPNVAVTAIATHPDRNESIVATTDGQGVFASNDRGDHWVAFRETSPLNGRVILDLADPTGTYVLVGTQGQSVWSIEIPKR